MTGIFLKRKFVKSHVKFPTGTIGIFSNAGNSAATSKYIFGSDAVLAGGNLSSNATGAGFAFGNSLQGIFQATPISSSSTATSKYFYSNDTSSAGSTIASILLSDRGAIGNSVLGVVATFNTCSIYTYGADIVSAGSALAGVAQSFKAIGDSVHGIFVSINTTATAKYLYATNVSTTGTSITVTPTGGGSSATSVETQGIMFITNSGNITNKYVFNSDTVTTGTSLLAFAGAAAGSDTEGVFRANTWEVVPQSTFTLVIAFCREGLLVQVVQVQVPRLHLTE